MKFRCVNYLCLSLIVMLYMEAVHTSHVKAYKKSKFEKGNGDEKAARVNLLWDLILAGKSSHKRTIRSGHLHKTRQHQELQQYHTTQRQLHDKYRNKNLDVHAVPLNVGLCNDQHPMCASYAMNGLCDSPGLFQNLDSIHNTCAFSCGYCKENVPDGEVDFVGAGWDEP